MNNKQSKRPHNKLYETIIPPNQDDKSYMDPLTSSHSKKKHLKRAKLRPVSWEFHELLNKFLIKHLCDENKFYEDESCL